MPTKKQKPKPKKKAKKKKKPNNKFVSYKTNNCPDFLFMWLSTKE